MQDRAYGLEGGHLWERTRAIFGRLLFRQRVSQARGGRVSPKSALKRLGSAARGDPMHKAADQLGRLLRTMLPHSVSLMDAFTRTACARITYAHVAEHLDLSKASVKRLFAQNELSLTRIDATCSLLGIELTDLAAAAVARTSMISQMTLAQEQELVEAPSCCWWRAQC